MEKAIEAGVGFVTAGEYSAQNTDMNQRKEKALVRAQLIVEKHF